MAFLEVRGLVKSYRRRGQWLRVVDDVSFHVDRGEAVGLLGPNGAGKTTSFRMTCGMITPEAGTVRLGGVNVTTWPMYRRAREGGMGYLAQDPSIFRKLSVEDNLLGVMELLGMEKAARMRRCDELLDQFKITGLRKNTAHTLSGGEKRRLEIARALVSNPKLILLDEPFTGIDPKQVQSIKEVISQLRSSGIGILITDHQARETLEITDRLYIICEGKVLCHGTPEEVVENTAAREGYFGEELARLIADLARARKLRAGGQSAEEVRHRTDGPAGDVPPPHDAVPATAPVQKASWRGIWNWVSGKKTPIPREKSARERI